MTDGQEKSDSGIVAAKPTNKVGSPAAELVEPRPEAKGNAEQQRTCTGHRAGIACPSRRTAYGRPQGSGQKLGTAQFHGAEFGR